MKRYTYLVRCSFQMQYTFEEAEVAQDPDGGEGDVEPAWHALSTLEEQLKECLAEFGALKLSVSADSEDLLGVDE